MALGYDPIDGLIGRPFDTFRSPGEFIRPAG